MKDKKTKYDRRRAIDCKLIRKSKSNPGYCKYEVTIAEKDGTTHKEPVYGRDMQDAISRLIWKERTYKIEKKINPVLGTSLIAVLIGFPALLAHSTEQPLYLMLSSTGVLTVLGSAFIWHRYIENG